MAPALLPGDQNCPPLEIETRESVAVMARRFSVRLCVGRKGNRALRTRAKTQCPVGALFWALDATSCALLQLVETEDAKRRALPKRKQGKDFSRKSLPCLMVETRGFEPPTSRVRC